MATPSEQRQQFREQCGQDFLHLPFQTPKIRLQLKLQLYDNAYRYENHFRETAATIACISKRAFTDGLPSACNKAVALTLDLHTPKTAHRQMITDQA
jgi:hypothetical protein